jgi:hypothetical protein
MNVYTYLILLRSRIQISHGTSPILTVSTVFFSHTSLMPKHIKTDYVYAETFAILVADVSKQHIGTGLVDGYRRFKTTYRHWIDSWLLTFRDNISVPG